MRYLLPALDILSIYAIYHLLPWPTFVFIYGSFILSIHVIVILFTIFKLQLLLIRVKTYNRSILDAFVLYLSCFILYITSPHPIAQYIAASTTIIFCFYYYIRYKTQQLF